MFRITIEHKSSCNTFFLIYCKNITNFLFWILLTCLVTSIKNNNINLLKLWCIYTGQKWAPFLTLRYCKDVTNLLLSVLWESLILPINNDNITLQEILINKVLESTWRKLWCLYACKKSTSSLTFFWRYCKDVANLLF